MLDEMFAQISRSLIEKPITKVETCPHCSSAAICVESKRYKRFPYHVKCLNPFCGCKTERFSSMEAAVRAWNRREVKSAEEKV